VRSVPVAAPVLFVMGFCGILFMAGSNSTVQLTCPTSCADAYEPAHARLRRQHAVRRLPHRVRCRGGGGDHGAARGGRGGLLSVLALLLWWNGRDRGPSLAREPGGRTRMNARRRLHVTRVRVGTSGWNYTEWKGSFYPTT